MTRLKLLFLSTPVGPLGSGIGGGVELTLQNLAQEMERRGHIVQVVAPAGSILPQRSAGGGSSSAADEPDAGSGSGARTGCCSRQAQSLQPIAGNLQVAAQTQSRDVPICMPQNAVLAHMWEYAHTVQSEWDLIVNFAFDWLPFYLTPFFECPIAHFISMGSMTDALDQIMEQVANRFPGTIGVYTQSQADTFPFAQSCRILGSGIDLSVYQFCGVPGDMLAWLGRIAPEKALEDAVAAAQMTGITLKVFGKMQEPNYWEKIRQDYPKAPVEYVGFLPTAALQQQLRQCRALLMTPRWVEAFGNVAIEALACGVPVIAYRRGGPAEIVQDGKTGFLVEPDRVTGLVEAIERIDEIDRCACRQQAEVKYSLEALGDRFQAWFEEISKNP